MSGSAVENSLVTEVVGPPWEPEIQSGASQRMAGSRSFESSFLSGAGSASVRIQHCYYHTLTLL